VQIKHIENSKECYPFIRVHSAKKQNEKTVCAAIKKCTSSQKNKTFHNLLDQKDLRVSDLVRKTNL
jgi:hypothetical protein